MARKINPARRTIVKEEDKFISFSTRLIEFFKRNLKVVLLGLILVILAAAGGAIIHRVYQQRAISAAELLETVRPELSQPQEADKSLAALQQVISKYPDSGAAFQARLFEANLLYQQQKYAEAAAIYKSLQGRHPGLRVLLTESLSYCWEGQKQFHRAAEILDPLVKDPQLPYRGELLQRQAMLYEQAGDRDRALTCYRRLLAQHPDSTFAPLIKEKIQFLEKQLKGK
ncbi:MAG: tetratricopeptide repeat protein [Desulfobacteraceae bacterium]